MKSNTGKYILYKDYTSTHACTSQGLMILLETISKEPNEKTLKAIEQIDILKKGKHFDTVEQLFEDLEYDEII